MTWLGGLVNLSFWKGYDMISLKDLALRLQDVDASGVPLWNATVTECWTGRTEASHHFLPPEEPWAGEATEIRAIFEQTFRGKRLALGCPCGKDDPQPNIMVVFACPCFIIWSNPLPGSTLCRFFFQPLLTTALPEMPTTLPIRSCLAYGSGIMETREEENLVRSLPTGTVTLATGAVFGIFWVDWAPKIISLLGNLDWNS